MIIDEKGKLFGKISIIDVAVIVILVLSIVGGALIFGFSGGGKAAQVSQIKTGDMVNKLTLKLSIEDVREVTKESLTPGTEVFAANTKKLLGVVEKVESTPRRQLITGLDGTMVYATVPEKYDLAVYLKTWGLKTETGCITESNQKIMPGEDILVKTVLLKTTPIIEEISENTEITKAAGQPEDTEINE